MRRPIPWKNSRCRDCPAYRPPAGCLDRRIRSGRCGDWIYYLRGTKQFRRLDVTPRDPRTPVQLGYRARLAAASRQYSDSLTQEQIRSCIAAGARRWTRLRLWQRGRLTGQLYWVRKQCSAKPAKSPPQEAPEPQPLQPQALTRSPWEQRRRKTLVEPLRHRPKAVPRSLLRGLSLPRCPSGSVPFDALPHWRRQEVGVAPERGPPERSGSTCHTRRTRPRTRRNAHARRQKLSPCSTGKKRAMTNPKRGEVCSMMLMVTRD